MKPQIPAQGILKTNEWGDAKAYHIVCDCGQPDHSHNLWIEAEDTGITVTIYADVKSPWWKWNRFKQIWKLLTQGYLQYETVLTMDQQTALNYSNTLKTAIDDVEKFRKSRDPKNKEAIKQANQGDCV